MADVQKEIALKVTTDVGQTNTALQSAEDRLTEAKKAMLELAMAGKQGSAEFRALAVEAGGLKAKIESVEQTVDGLGKSANQIEVFSGAVQGVAAGFALAQGTAALFAEGNEELQESLVRVQASLALLQGTEQAVQLLRKESAAGQALLTAKTAAYNLVVGASTGALKAFRIALVATGIGAVVVLVGLLVANWEKLTNAINPASKALNDYNKESEKAEEISKKRAAATDLEIRRLKALGVEEIELMRIKRAAVEQDIKDTDRRLAAQQKALELAIAKFSEQQADLVKGTYGAVGQLITNFFGVSLDDLVELDKKLEEVKLLRKELGVEIIEIDSDINKTITDNSEKVRQQIISDLEVEMNYRKEVGESTLEVEEKLLREKLSYAKLTKTGVMQAQAELRLFLTRNDRERAAEQKAADEKMLQDRVKAEFDAKTELANIQNEIRRSKLTDYQREREDFLLQRQKMLELMRTSGVAEIELQLFAQNTARLERNAAYEKEVADAKAKDDKKLSDQKAAIFASIEVAKMGLQGIADLAAFFAGESEAQQKKAFEIQKRVNIATTIIDGILSAQKAYSSLIGTPIVGPVLAPIAAAAAIAAALARVTAIKSTSFQSTAAPANTGGGGTIPSPSGGQQQPPAAFNPNVTATNPTGQPNPQGGQNGTTRVIVVESDIRRVTTRVDAAERFATFGN